MRFLLVTTLLILGCSLSIKAQTTSGKLVYSMRQKIDFDERRLEGMTDEQKAMIKKRVMKMGHQKKILLFTPQASLFREYDPIKDGHQEATYQDDHHMHMMTMRPKHIVFHQSQPDTVVQQREMFGKQFLIKGLEKPRWQFTAQQDTVMGMVCQKARCTIDSTLIVVSFTPAIPVNSGPSTYFGLPGMVLKAVIDSGKVIFEAIRIESLTDEDGATITPPEKGKEVTQKEFEAIVAEKQKEMEEMYGGRGGKRMEIHMGH